MKVDPQLIAALQGHGRRRAIVLKSRMMVENRLRAIVAGKLGYVADTKVMTKAEGKKLFKKADQLIKDVIRWKKQQIKGSHTPAALPIDPDYAEIIFAHYGAIDSLRQFQKKIDCLMQELAVKLPAAAWAEAFEQRGFGLGFLSIIVGEAGDLANYSCPDKLWRRFGLRPQEYDGKRLMGSTWKMKQEGILPSSVWSEFGYCPRRRSLAFLIGQNIKMQNKGEYRARFEEKKKEAALAHPDWKPIRCDRHGMLVAAKRLLRNLWCQWNDRPEINSNLQKAV